MEFPLDITLDRQHLHEALTALLHTVLFYRTFGPLIPETREFLDTPYPFVSLLEEDINNHVNALKLDDVPSRIQVLLKFQENKTSWFGKASWETWAMDIIIDNNSMHFDHLNDEFANVVKRIGQLADAEKEHIPVITSPEALPFGYTVTIT